MARTLKLYKLPDTPLTPGLRPLVRTDVPHVSADLPSRLLSMYWYAWLPAELCSAVLSMVACLHSWLLLCPHGA